jgi:hypothetical protein
MLIKLEDNKSRAGADFFFRRVVQKAEAANARNTDSCHPWWDLSQLGHCGRSYSCS